MAQSSLLIPNWCDGRRKLSLFEGQLFHLFHGRLTARQALAKRGLCIVTRVDF